MFLSLLFSTIIGYIIGSVPFGLVLTKAAGLGDIRKIGSGNIGATNVLRTGRKDLAFLTLICDLSKAAVAALLCQWLFQSHVIGIIAGCAAVIGHNYPVWLKFKGGKGVAATFGLMVAMTPSVGILGLLTWLATAIIFRYSSLAALTALTLAPVYALFLAEPPRFETAGIYFVLTILSYYRHRSNIQRLLAGEESRIKFGKKK